MIKEQSQNLIQQFIANTIAEGMLVTDSDGSRLYSTTSTLNDSVMDEIAAIATVTDAMYSKINNKLKIDDNEMTVIVNKSDYIIIKKIQDTYILLSQIKRVVDIDLIYDEMNILAEGLSLVK